MELPRVHTSKCHEANPRSLRPTVPGIGTILSRGRLDASHQLDRVPRLRDVASYCRMATCAKESAGKRSGTSGTKIGNAHLKWAFSEAAVLCLRDHPTGEKFLARLENKHSQGKALTILAHKLARAVYYMFKHKTAF